MLKIGVTGGIGSGKTTICRIFEIIGIPIFYADIEAKKIMSANKEIISDIKKEIGSNAYLKNGNINRLYLKTILFSNPEVRQKLNTIVHPKVITLFNKWANDQKAPYIIKEAALIFESGSYKELDKIIVVTAPEKLRIRRIVERDGVTENQVKSIIKTQISEKEKISRSDYVIHNDSSELIIPKVLEIHSQLQLI